MTTKKQRHAEVQKRVSKGNVQALERIFQDFRLKCPSGSQFLKDLDMDMKVDFIWLPIDRVALLPGSASKDSASLH